MKYIAQFLILLLSISTISCKKNIAEKMETDAEVEETVKEAVQDKPILKKLWATDTIFKTPESVLYDQKRNVLYVANVNMNPWKKDGNGFISKITTDGKPIKIDWVTGLNSAKGMGVYEDKLYVTDVDAVVEIDIEAGKILNRYAVDDTMKLNDISIDSDGTVYISDMQEGRIFTLQNDKMEVWKEGLNAPNGVFVEADRILIASSGDGSLRAYDKTTKEETMIANDMTSGDGLEATQSGDYVMSNWGGEIFFVKDGNSTLLLDTKEQKKQTADIGIIKYQNIILVPTFFDNRVVAYKLEM